MNSAHRAYQYLKHYFKSGTEHSVHSPFVFELIEDVIKPSAYYVFDEIEALRAAMLLSDIEIEVHDYGAGQVKGEKRKRRISEIARRSLKPSEESQMLFRLVKMLQPANALELGTSLGITSAYIASALNDQELVTLEGCPNTLKVAKLNWEKVGVQNVKCIQGNFDSTLPQFLKDVDSLDFVFFDGNHRYQPTIDYFEMCLKKSHDQSVFVFDDIHWSSEMTKAWNDIKARPEVLISIDLFNLGLVFFRSKQPKQHFDLKRKLLR